MAKQKSVEQQFAEDAAPVPAPSGAEKPGAEAVSEASFGRDLEGTAKALRKQNTVRVRLYQVPKDSTDRPLPDEFVQINGHGYLIQRGVAVDVPESVYEVLEQAGRL
jgi:hypothetical protein